MITLKTRQIGAFVLSLFIAGGAVAKPVSELEPWVAQAFEQLPVESVEILADAEMAQTQGELWPFIAAVVTLDLTLASFFWGTYLPAMAYTSRTPSICASCPISGHSGW